MGITKHNKHSAPQCDLSKLVKGGSPPLLPNYGMFRGAYETIASTLHLHMIAVNWEKVGHLHFYQIMGCYVGLMESLQWCTLQQNVYDCRNVAH